MRWMIIVAMLAGCNSEPSADIRARAAELSSGFAKQADKILTKQDETLTALAAIKSQVENLASETREATDTLKASLVKSTPNGKDGDPASALKPQGPQRESKITSPPIVSAPAVRSFGAVKMSYNISGNWSPTIIETANHLRDEHGVNIDGMTHQQLHDLHANLHNGTASKPVAVKSYPVQIVNQGTYCPNGQCPTPRQVKVKRRR